MSSDKITLDVEDTSIQLPAQLISLVTRLQSTGECNFQLEFKHGESTYLFLSRPYEDTEAESEDDEQNVSEEVSEEDEEDSSDGEDGIITIQISTGKSKKVETVEVFDYDKFWESIEKKKLRLKHKRCKKFKYVNYDQNFTISRFTSKKQGEKSRFIVGVDTVLFNTTIDDTTMEKYFSTEFINIYSSFN